VSITLTDTPTEELAPSPSPPTEQQTQQVKKLVVQVNELFNAPFVGVATHDRMPGVKPPGMLGHTYDWREKPGSPANTANIVHSFEVHSLKVALETDYGTDAHCVPYVLFKENGVLQRFAPRVTKAAIPWLAEQGYHLLYRVLFADIDNPQHRPWDDELIEATLERIRNSYALQKAGLFFTSRGMRFVQPLDRWVDANAYIAYSEHWYRALELDGFEPDWDCCEPMRLFRLPSVVRKDGLKSNRKPDITPMCEVPPPPIDPTPRQPTRKLLVNTVYENLKYLEKVPAKWREPAKYIGSAVFENVKSHYHKCYLAVGGALLQHEVEPSLVPAIVYEVACNARSSKPEGHHRSAQDTVNKFLAGLPVSGIRTLREEYPEVSEAFARALYTLGPLPKPTTLPKPQQLVPANPPPKTERKKPEAPTPSPIPQEQPSETLPQP